MRWKVTFRRSSVYSCLFAGWMAFWLANTVQLCCIDVPLPVSDTGLSGVAADRGSIPHTNTCEAIADVSPAPALIATDAGSDPGSDVSFADSRNASTPESSTIVRRFESPSPPSSVPLFLRYQRLLI